jgi:hypothetical protein
MCAFGWSSRATGWHLRKVFRCAGRGDGRIARGLSQSPRYPHPGAGCLDHRRLFAGRPFDRVDAVAPMPVQQGGVILAGRRAGSFQIERFCRIEECARVSDARTKRSFAIATNRA